VLCNLFFLCSFVFLCVCVSVLGLMGELTDPMYLLSQRRKDLQLWDEGDRNSSRLAWLLAPASAFTGATQFKTDMQNSTRNWQKACEARQVGSASEGRLLALATIAALHENETQDEVVHSSN
jgi:hypothetical protein